MTRVIPIRRVHTQRVAKNPEMTFDNSPEINKRSRNRTTVELPVVYAADRIRLLEPHAGCCEPILDGAMLRSILRCATEQMRSRLRTAHDVCNYDKPLSDPGNSHSLGKIQ